MINLLAIVLGGALGLAGLGAALAPNGLASFGEGLQRFAASAVGLVTLATLVLAWLAW